MSGIYGTIKPADIDINNDVEIFYNYRESYSIDDTNFSNFKSIDSSILEVCKSGDNGIPISGLFNLRLPLDKFNKKGIYTIYIRPKEMNLKIDDIGVLAAFNDVRGVVFKKEDLNSFNGANSLTGYRIEYLNEEGNKNGDFNIITSSNKAQPTTYTLVNNSSEKSVKYYYTEDGSTIFCTVTPSLAPTFKPNSLPYIGKSGEYVKIVNTKFNPVMIELELVEHDEETISYMLEGNQLIDKDNALITTFNNEGEIYHQSEFGVYKDNYGNPLYEFKKVKNNIDFNQNLDDLE